MRYLTFLITILLGGNLLAQTTTPVVDQTEEVIANDRQTQDMFNRQDPSVALQGGGAFFISAPPPAYEMDTEKAYLTEEFEPLRVTLLLGDEHTLSGRLRLVDHKFEVIMEGGVYELDNQRIRGVTTEDGRQFVPSYDPLGRQKGTLIYEELVDQDKVRFLLLRSAIWSEPAEQTMFDTRDVRRTLESEERMVLVVDGAAFEVKRLRDVYVGLGLDKNSPTVKFAKKQKLRAEPADITQLLNYYLNQ